MNPKLLAAACGILTATAQSQPYCWWNPSVLYVANQPGYTPGYWAFAYQTPVSAVVQVGFSYYYTNQVLTHTWYITTAGKVVDVDPGTLRGGSNIVVSLPVSVCGTGIKSIHASIQGITSAIGYNEAHNVLQQAE